MSPAQNALLDSTWWIITVFLIIISPLALTLLPTFSTHYLRLTLLRFSGIHLKTTLQRECRSGIQIPCWPSWWTMFCLRLSRIRRGIEVKEQSYIWPTLGVNDFKWYVALIPIRCYADSKRMAHTPSYHVNSSEIPELSSRALSPQMINMLFRHSLLVFYTTPSERP